MAAIKEQTAVQWMARELGITSGTMLEKAIEMERKQIEHSYDFGNSRIGLSSYGIADGSDYYLNLHDTEEL